MKLRGKDEQEMLDLWNEAVARGGFSVSDGDVLKFKSKKVKEPKEDKKGKDDGADELASGDFKYEFDDFLALTSADGPGIRLVAFATDSSGNASIPIDAFPPSGKNAKPAVAKPDRPNNKRRKKSRNTLLNPPSMAWSLLARMTTGMNHERS